MPRGTGWYRSHAVAPETDTQRELDGEPVRFIKCRPCYRGDHCGGAALGNGFECCTCDECA